MGPGAYFGKPREEAASGGFHVTVYLVPVLDGRLVVFDIERPRDIAGRWLPWAVLPFQGNPYEAASNLVDAWCDVPLDDLSLVDVMSFTVPGAGWELALVFRAELMEAPVPIPDREPIFIGADALDAIGPFDPADLQRWLAGPAPAPAKRPPGAQLLF